jgi:hypothetical protein
MQVILADQTIADWGEGVALQDFTGEGVTDEVEVVRAATKFLEYRGNEVCNFSFVTTKFFENLAAAESFYLSYFSTLTKQGSCVFNCGYGEDDPNLTVLASANVILKRMRALDPIGCSMKFQFFLVTGAIAA